MKSKKRFDNKRGKKVLTVMLSVFIIIVIPIIIAWGVNIKLFDLISFNMDPADWFAFWGSYIGAVATIVLAVINLFQSWKIEQLQTKPSISSISIELSQISPGQVSKYTGSIINYKGSGQEVLYHIGINIDYNNEYRFKEYRLTEFIVGTQPIPIKDDDFKKIHNVSSIDFVLSSSLDKKGIQYLKTNMDINYPVKIRFLFEFINNRGQKYTMWLYAVLSALQGGQNSYFSEDYVFDIN